VRRVSTTATGWSRPWAERPSDTARSVAAGQDR
jgi:hypothetical protein